MATIRLSLAMSASFTVECSQSPIAPRNQLDQLIYVKNGGESGGMCEGRKCLQDWEIGLLVRGGDGFIGLMYMGNVLVS